MAYSTDGHGRWAADVHFAKGTTITTGLLDHLTFPIFKGVVRINLWAKTTGNGVLSSRSERLGGWNYRCADRRRC